MLVEVLQLLLNLSLYTYRVYSDVFPSYISELLKCPNSMTQDFGVIYIHIFRA